MGSLNDKQQRFVAEYLVDPLNVRPALSREDLRDGALAHAILGRQRALCGATPLVQRPDGGNVWFHQASKWVAGPLGVVLRTYVRRVPTLAGHVQVVVGPRSREQVVGTDTPAIVAMVTDARREVAVGNREAHAMGEERSIQATLGRVKATVAGRVQSARPLPTAVAARNERPKTVTIDQVLTHG